MYWLRFTSYSKGFKPWLGTWLDLAVQVSSSNSNGRMESALVKKNASSVVDVALDFLDRTEDSRVFFARNLFLILRCNPWYEL